MLAEMNGAIVESQTITTTGFTTNATGYVVPTTTTGYWDTTGTMYWGNYPVYVCTDKTKKAIDVLKALQADKLIECKSVSKFIELVDKIAGLL